MSLSRDIILSEIKKLIFLNRGLSRTIRYAKERSGENILTQSVSEHVTGMRNLANYFRFYADPDLTMDWNKVSLMIDLHDVGEIKTGDIIDTVKNPNHFNEERNALTSILDDLPHFFSTKIEHIFDEVSKLSTNEAKFVHAIDKLEAQLWWLGEEAVEEIIKLNLSKGNAPWNSSHNQYLREKKLLQDFGFKKMEEFLDIIFEEKVKMGLGKHKTSLQNMV